MAVSGFVAKFVSEEDGSTPFALIWFCVLLLLGGVGLDTSNAWRHKQLLQQTADVAAHSGTVALSQGLSDGDVIARVKALIDANLPSETYGTVLAGPDDIRILGYDAKSGALDGNGSLRNAVAVTLHRDDEVANPVNLLMLRIASIFSQGEGGLGPWQIRARSIAVVAPTALCDTSDMFHAQGVIELTSNQSFGAGYCVHSQTSVWMPSGSTFDPGAVVSMPDLDDCQNKCSDAVNPGAGSAAREVNMPLPDIGAFISATEYSLLAERGTLFSSFFANKPIQGDTSQLVDAGIMSPGAMTGTVIGISARDFNSLDQVPSGVTFSVSCKGKYPDRIADKKGKGAGKGGNQLDLEGEYRNIAILSDCPVSLGPSTQMTGVMLLLAEKNAQISAHSHSAIGDVSGECNPGDRTTILTRGSIHAPAGFASSNVAIVSQGDVFFAGSGGSSVHRGLSIRTEGSIHTSSGHSFLPCKLRPANEPTGRVIRHIGEQDLPA